MEHLRLSKTSAGFHIEDFPEAVKVIQVATLKGRRLAALALHKADLDFAEDCLSAVNTVPGEQQTIRQALWRSAVTHFMKCFGSSKARFPLNAGNILKGDSEGIEVFGYFKSLRDKHLAHDENSFAQALPGAILNNGGKSYKIEKVVCLAVIADTLNQGDFSNLHLLIQKTQAWVVAEFDTVCKALTEELEAVSYSDLLARPSVEYSKPAVNEVNRTRGGSQPPDASRGLP